MPLRIAIADDEPLIRLDLKELLGELGYSVVAEAGDGREAWTRIEETRPDVVILDIKMPSLSGIDLAQKLKERYPVILLTAYSEINLVKQAQRAGVMAYLTKPFKKADLTPVIELAMGQFLEKKKSAETVERLKDQLETRKLVEKAKGLLMELEKLSESEAYQRIQKISMKKNQSMKEVAKAVITMYG